MAHHRPGDLLDGHVGDVDAGPAVFLAGVGHGDRPAVLGGRGAGAESPVDDAGHAILRSEVGLVFALLLSRLWFGKADLTMALNGALAGLVAITAEPLTPTPLAATMIGAAGGLLVVASIVTLDKLKVDDPVGAISVHGTVGIWGLLAVCFTNPDASLVAQLKGIVAIFAWVFAASFIVWFILKKTVGIRVSEEEEYEGVDLSECGLEAYPEFTSVRP